MRRGAESATASMFPWERKQMDGSSKPMSRFDKVYWAAFAGAAIFLIVVNGKRYFMAKEPPKVCTLPTWPASFQLYMLLTWRAARKRGKLQMLHDTSTMVGRWTWLLSKPTFRSHAWHRNHVTIAVLPTCTALARMKTMSDADIMQQVWHAVML
jgi:hypothetical protein